MGEAALWTGTCVLLLQIINAQRTECVATGQGVRSLPSDIVGPKAHWTLLEAVACGERARQGQQGKAPLPQLWLLASCPFPYKFCLSVCVPSFCLLFSLISLLLFGLVSFIHKLSKVFFFFFTFIIYLFIFFVCILLSFPLSTVLFLSVIFLFLYLSFI